MAHPTDNGAEAIDAPEVHDQDSAVEALRSMDIADPDEVPTNAEANEPPPIDEDDEFTEDDLEGDEPEGEAEEEADESDEQETAIDAPVSLNKAEKEAFSQLPAEAQQFVTQLESRRASQVQEATTKASQAQRDAEARAAAADAEAKQVYSQQLDQFLTAFAPQAPDPQMAYSDPQRYVAAKAQYDAQKAQHDELVQQVKGIGTEATQALDKSFYEQRDRELMAIPEVANEETRKSYLDKAMGAANKLGYDVAELTQTMDAEDVKRLHSVAEAFEKAEKYDAAMSRKMKRVRAGKQRTNKPGVAQPKGSTARKSQEASMQRLKQSGSQEDAVAALSHLIS